MPIPVLNLKQLGQYVLVNCMVEHIAFVIVQLLGLLTGGWSLAKMLGLCIRFDISSIQESLHLCPLHF